MVGEESQGWDAECQSRYFFFDNWNIPNEFEKDCSSGLPQTDTR